MLNLTNLARRVVPILMVASMACDEDPVRPTRRNTIPDIARPSTTTVPEHAPDSVPAWLYDAALWVTDTSRYSVPFVRDIVVIRFVAGATQQERQDAVDAVGGTVVGGVPFAGMEGSYYASLAPDSTNQAMFVAIDTLRAMPQVDDAMPSLIITDGFAYRRPNDGLGLRREDWRLSPDSAFGDPSRATWALEAINAPYAWAARLVAP